VNFIKCFYFLKNILNIMQVRHFIGGYDNNLSYVIWCEKTNSAAIIDPSVEPDEILKFIKKKSLILEKIIITHSHFDHIKYLKELIKINRKNINIYISDQTNHKDLLTKNLVSHNQTINIGNQKIHCLYTPGHLNDSVSYWLPENKIIFTGDTMFIGRTGRVTSNKSNISDLYKSIYNILLKLPSETIICSGHDYGKKLFATIEYNIKNSPFFSCKSLNEFKIVMNNYEKNRNK
tara:strand:+ start:815 stop:1516 length:702 start_codon:yes stop_codon:yes gene_type:complete